MGKGIFDGPGNGGMFNTSGGGGLFSSNENKPGENPALNHVDRKQMRKSISDIFEKANAANINNPNNFNPQVSDCEAVADYYWRKENSSILFLLIALIGGFTSMLNIELSLYLSVFMPLIGILIFQASNQKTFFYFATIHIKNKKHKDLVFNSIFKKTFIWYYPLFMSLSLGLIGTLFFVSEPQNVYKYAEVEFNLNNWIFAILNVSSVLLYIVLRVIEKYK
jgi:hypothetical protein